MSTQSNSPAPTGPLAKLHQCGEALGVSAAEADRLAKATLKRLRASNPRVSETLFYVAGQRSIAHFAREKALRAGAVDVRDWCDAANDAAEAFAQDPERAKDAVEGLPEDLRAVYRMLVVDDMAYDAIAAKLGCDVEDVQAQIFRAKEILRGRLAAMLT